MWIFCWWISFLKNIKMSHLLASPLIWEILSIRNLSSSQWWIQVFKNLISYQSSNFSVGSTGGTWRTGFLHFWESARRIAQPEYLGFATPSRETWCSVEKGLIPFTPRGRPGLFLRERRTWVCSSSRSFLYVLPVLAHRVSNKHVLSGNSINLIIVLCHHRHF